MEKAKKNLEITTFLNVTKKSDLRYIRPVLVSKSPPRELNRFSVVSTYRVIYDWGNLAIYRKLKAGAIRRISPEFSKRVIAFIEEQFWTLLSELCGLIVPAVQRGVFLFSMRYIPL